MKPIRATYNYTVTVPCDYTNPLHEKYIGMEYAVENRQLHGFVTEIIRLMDNAEGKTSDGVYAIFWADFGDTYKLMVEDYYKFTITAKEMRNYVAAYNV